MRQVKYVAVYSDTSAAFTLATLHVGTQALEIRSRLASRLASPNLVSSLSAAALVVRCPTADRPAHDAS
jgi:hypothetical protein